MNKRIFSLCMIAVFLCTILASCSPADIIRSVRDELELFGAEYAEVMQFFDKDPVMSSDPSKVPEPAVPDEKSAPVLESLTRTDMIATPFFSGRRIIFDSGTPIAEEELPSETYLSVYTAVPHFRDLKAQAVLETLRSHGITAEIRLTKSPAPEGEVCAVTYAGYSGNGTYYMNPKIPVTLYVSDKKDASVSHEKQKNLVYLTFDDGPTDSDTLRLLDILDTYGVKAAFFTMGEELAKFPHSAKAIADRGHALGCHTVTHNYSSIYKSADSLIAEVTAWEKLASDAGITLKSKLFRFPGGSVGTYLTTAKAENMIVSLESMGYTVFDWNVVTNDSLLYMAPSSKSTYDYIKENFIETFEKCLRENESKDNAPIIILMHETVPETVDLMPWMLEYIISRGYVFGDLAQFGGSWTFADR